jgi:hypothetical protein
MEVLLDIFNEGVVDRQLIASTILGAGGKYVTLLIRFCYKYYKKLKIKKFNKRLFQFYVGG